MVRPRCVRLALCWRVVRADGVALEVHEGGTAGATYQGGHVAHAGQVFFDEPLTGLDADALRAGIISLAHGAMICLGAYATAILTVKYGWTFWPAALVSILVLPLYVPVLIFGLSASQGSANGPEIATASLLILTAITLVAESLSLSVRARICRRLLKLTEATEELELTQDQLAKLLGLARTTVSSTWTMAHKNTSRPPNPVSYTMMPR